MVHELPQPCIFDVGFLVTVTSSLCTYGTRMKIFVQLKKYSQEFAFPSIFFFNRSMDLSMLFPVFVREKCKHSGVRWLLSG